MLDWDGVVKLIDFGIAWDRSGVEQREERTMIHEVGTGYVLLH
jgi:serine/threonine protein kinase